MTAGGDAAPASADRLRSVPLLAVALCMTATGAAALVEEILWARMLHRLLGSTSLAVATVLAGFLGGIALGAAVANASRERVRRPLLALGVVEIAAGAAAVVFTAILDAAAPLAALSAGPGVLLALVVVFTVPLGAGFPFLVHALEGTPRGARTRDISVLYGLNALGGGAGAVLAGFVAIPLLGESMTLACGAALQLAAGGLIAWLARRPLPIEAGAGVGPEVTRIDASRLDVPHGDAVHDAAPSPPSRRAASAALRLHALLFTSGLLAFYQEVLWTRVLVLVVGSSVYAFAVVTAGVLIGIGGASVLLSAARGRGNGFWALPVVLAWTLAAAFFAVPYLPDAYLLGVRALPAGSFVWGVTVAGLAALVPSLLVGALFPWAVACAPARCGSLVAVNALGAAAGAFLAGPVGAALWSLEAAFELGVLLAGALALCGLAVSAVASPVAAGAPSAVARGPRLGARVALASVLALAPAAVVWLPGTAGESALERDAWDMARLVSGVYQWPRGDLLDPEVTVDAHAARREVLAIERGREVMVTVELDREANTVHVKGSGKTEGSVPARAGEPSRASMPTQVLLAVYPAILRPGASAAAIGLGSGVTVGALHRAGCASLDVLEIEAAFRRAIERPELASYFEPYVGEALRSERVRFHVGDARRLLLGPLRARRWGVVVSQPSEPWTAGSAALFTREFFELVASRLEPDGVFVQWVQLYKIDADGLRLLVRTYRRVFNRVYVVRPPGTGALVLLGSRSPLRLDPLLEPLAPNVARLLAEANVPAPEDLLALVLLGPTGVEQWVDDAPSAPLNTDARNALEFRGPLLLHEELDLARANLAALRRLGGADPVSRYVGRDRLDAAMLRRLAARNAYYGDFEEALALLADDASDDARELRRAIEQERDVHEASESR